MRPPVAVLALLALACSSAPRRGNTVILASGADLQSPNPLLTVHPLARQIQRYCLLVTLVRYDSTLTPIPYLAREWHWSADRRLLTLRIFQGLHWHDGAPTTARDAAWTLNAALDPASGYPRHADLANLHAVVAPDDSTLELRFAEPAPAIPDVLTDLALLPAHRFATVPLGQLRQAEWNRRPVGNGPFRFVAYQPNRRWVFEANPDFPPELGGPPKLQRFVIAVVDEPTTKLAALTSGELDFAGINPAHAEFVRRNPSLRVLDYPLLFSYALVFNLRRPPFARLEARRAVAAAIDAKPIVDGVLFGFGTPATSPLPAMRGELPRFGFEMLTVGSGEAALEQMLQAQLAAAGVRAEIRQLELATYLDRVQGQAHAFEAAVMGISGDLAQGHLARLVALAGLRTEGGSERLLRLIQDSLPAVFLYHARGVQGINRRVQGVQMDLRGELVTLSQWWVKAGER
ncbi:MAG TPA: ABC transporter substrate-binding protein [Gemmatimonadales bacterium]|nr:ABC transporter substrate-binding protein [Gemmatimonadales bacterium]